jgi:hypothetical protein
MSRNPFSIQKLEDQNLQEMLSVQLEQCLRHHTRTCYRLPDMTFILTCLKRVITQNQSGRDFLQFLHEVEEQNVKRSTFFEALKSQRRLHTVSEMSHLYHSLLSNLLSSAGIDHLAEFPELADYEVFSADGHFIEHPSHVKKQGSRKVYAAGSIYIQNIRNGLIQLLSPVTDGSSKEHELPHFKHAIEVTDSINKIIWVLDRAYIDYRWWEKQKAKGRNIISRTKSNMSVLYCGTLTFDADDPVNAGVVSDRLGGFSNTRSTMRIIDYIDPETGEEMTFYSTLNSNIRPGLICWLYFLRWKIEKSFDCFKNDLGEKKAWATGKNALQIQGYSICIIYNFIQFLSETVQKTHQCKDKKAEKKYYDGLKKRKAIAEAKGRFIHPMLFLSRSISKISAQLIRLVRNHFASDKPLRLIIPLFIQRLEVYL